VSITSENGEGGVIIKAVWYSASFATNELVTPRMAFSSAAATGSLLAFPKMSYFSLFNATSSASIIAYTEAMTTLICDRVGLLRSANELCRGVNAAL
jgi:hypothetical protein